MKLDHILGAVAMLAMLAVVVHYGNTSQKAIDQICKRLDEERAVATLELMTLDGIAVSPQQRPVTWSPTQRISYRSNLYQPKRELPAGDSGIELISSEGYPVEQGTPVFDLPELAEPASPQQDDEDDRVSKAEQAIEAIMQMQRDNQDALAELREAVNQKGSSQTVVEGDLVAEEPQPESTGRVTYGAPVPGPVRTYSVTETRKQRRVIEEDVPVTVQKRVRTVQVPKYVEEEVAVPVSVKKTRMVTKTIQVPESYTDTEYRTETRRRFVGMVSEDVGEVAAASSSVSYTSEPIRYESTVCEPCQVYSSNVYSQPIYASSSVNCAPCQTGYTGAVYGQPVYGQPVYGQPVYGYQQPTMYATTAQPLLGSYRQVTPNYRQPVNYGSTVYSSNAGVAYAQPSYGAVYGQPSYGTTYSSPVYYGQTVINDDLNLNAPVDPAAPSVPFDPGSVAFDPYVGPVRTREPKVRAATVRAAFTGIRGAIRANRTARRATPRQQYGNFGQSQYCDENGCYIQ